MTPEGRGVTRRRWLALAVASALAGPAPAAAGAFVVRDMLGRPVTLAGPPRRIVSLVPSATEIVFALGGEERLVGVTDYCDFPPAARAKPSVGGMLSPSLEAIVALRPDLVLATEAGNRHETFVQLQQLGIAVYLVHANRLADLRDVTGRLAALTGREAALAALLADLDGRIARVVRAVRRVPRRRVLYVLWPEPLIVPGRDALLTELIGLAGGTSVTADEPSDYPRFSLEAAVARAPDVILLARHGAGTGPVDRSTWDRLGSLPAVRAGRISTVSGDLLHRYGPRIVDGLEALARAIHPEAFR